MSYDSVQSGLVGPRADPKRIKRKPGSEIAEGDTMVWLGKLYRVAEITAYVPSPKLPPDFMPAGTRVARWEGMSSGIVLEPDGWYEVGT